MPQKTINATASGDNTLVDVDATSCLGVYDYVLTAAGAVTAILEDQVGTEFGRYTFGAAGQSIHAAPVGAGGERFETQGDLVLNLSGAVAVTGHVTYSVKR